MSESKLVRALNVVPKIISEEDGLVDYVASDESVDSYSEVIAASGWRFTRFAKNAPFVDSHDYESIKRLLGRVERAWVDGRSLIERVRWAKDVAENALAQLGWKMTVGGYLRAVSVGFYPVRTAYRGREGWNEALAKVGLQPEQGENIRAIYLEQEQVELSACIIGSNPNALAKSWADGCVRDADLARCGFDDEDMEFLRVAGEATSGDGADETTRLLIAREVRRILRKANQSGNAPTPTSTAPGKPSGGVDAERMAEERLRFLQRLRSI